MSTIKFQSKLYKIGTWTILKLPANASAKLPSRGQVMVEGTINNFHFQSALEPDGQGNHWFKVEESVRKGAGADVGDTVTLEIEPSKVWPEPKIPADIKSALAEAPQIQVLWKDITPMARWAWIRWISGTKQAETRKHRIEVAFSKLRAGERRPCCFNRNMCMEPYVSKNGRLMEPAEFSQ